MHQTSELQVFEGLENADRDWQWRLAEGARVRIQHAYCRPGTEKILFDFYFYILYFMFLTNGD